ncbi:isoaspartyl peptidase/L-asparaginase [Paraflavisolibacter sp. H34]|uniref:isoaspartyl peptidase/L-asparaginase family protein n=1 Tax=Huijunlia imazamoxiresistens TaxID=3127457 RepID=UPI00301A6782
MKTILFLLLLLPIASPDKPPKAAAVVLVIHGGAGAISRQQLGPEREKAYREGLLQALQAGYALLQKGGSALDAVETAVRLLEDNPLFNAGKGAVFTQDGRNELDASIMDGNTLAAGAVAGVTTVKNPVSAARAVMEKSPHVLLAGPGADQFAAEQGLDTVPPSYFRTDERWKGYQKSRQQDSLRRLPDSSRDHSRVLPAPVDKFGTVGAVALDRQGNLAAATSTGGMSNKKYGRIGDSPLIGAGTYANNATCAVSCTGWGEYFIRLVVAKTVSDLVEYKKYPLQRAASELILQQVPRLGGDGGLIAVDKAGNIALPFNTAGMFRAYTTPRGELVVKIYKE